MPKNPIYRNQSTTCLLYLNIRIFIQRNLSLQSAQKNTLVINLNVSRRQWSIHNFIKENVSKGPRNGHPPLKTKAPEILPFR